MTRTLLVDDESALRSLMRLVLERSGRYAVVGEAGDGREAIDLAVALRPDLVLLDLSMPGMGGIEALPQLRRALPLGRLVVLSARSSRAMLGRAKEAGADAYLLKGMGATALLTAIASAAPDAPTTQPV